MAAAVTQRASGAAVRALIYAGAFGITSGASLAFTYFGHQGYALSSACVLAAALAVTLAGTEWLSPSPNGPGASLMLGISSGVGTVVPAVPEQFLPGVPAAVASVLIAAVLVAGVTLIQALSEPQKSWKRAAAETYGLFTAVLIASLLALAAVHGVSGAV